MHQLETRLRKVERLRILATKEGYIHKVAQANKLIEELRFEAAVISSRRITQPQSIQSR